MDAETEPTRVDPSPTATAFLFELDGSTILWAWYAFLVVFCCWGNIIHLTYVWRKTQSADGAYAQSMRILAIPWVINCAYRSLFPSLYLQRYVFWDTPLNGILVDRGFACVGELCCVFQTSLALRHVDREITGGRRWVQASGWLAFVVYIIAEGCSYYNVATTNELWCAIEVDVDALSYLIMLPASVYLLMLCPGHIMASSAKKFLAVMVPLTVLYPLYNFFIDAPMYLRRYAADQKAGKHYFGFIEGLKDAATRRVYTHEYDNWKEDMTWMVLYFFLGAAGGILLMYAPKLDQPSDKGKKISTMTKYAYYEENTVQSQSGGNSFEKKVEL
jgi:hypothetical protein